MHAFIVVCEDAVKYRMGNMRVLTGSTPREAGKLWLEIAEAARWLGERGATSIEVLDGRAS